MASVSLDAALSGLIAARQQLDTVSKNIANAGTVGYTKKVVQQENLVINGRGLGTRTLNLARKIDESLIAQVNQQYSVASSYTIRQTYLDKIQAFHGASNTGQALSAQLTALANTFTPLSAAPDDPTLQNQVILAAQNIATKLNNFSDLLTSLRANAESDIAASIIDINGALERIASMNLSIDAAKYAGQSTADMEDIRDTAINVVAKYLNINTYKSDNQIFVTTTDGEMLANERAHKLYFTPSTMMQTSYYGPPAGTLNGIHVDSPTGRDITQAGIGGQLGALVDLRDQVLPQYMAQIDEFSQQLSTRFANEGLKLFVDSGISNVPPNDPNSASPLGYLGYAAKIKVNAAIKLNPSLIRDGTTGNTEQAGSSEVIRRVAQFAFSTTRYLQADGTTVIGGIGSLVNNLPLVTTNNVIGTVNLASYPNMGAVPGLTTPGAFRLSINGVPPQTIDILSTDTVYDVVNTINGFFPGVASVNGLGQLKITSTFNIDVADGGPPAPNPPIGAPGIAALGLAFANQLPPQPTFTVQLGNRPPVTVSIAPGDTSVQLLATLNAIPGITASLNGANGLRIIPTDGGDITLVDGLGAPLAAMGVTVSAISHQAFAQTTLGGNGTISTGLLANSTLQDYISGIISAQGQDANLNQSQQDQQNQFLQTLTARNNDLSGVNIDAEMSDLIRIQSAYSAAAKMITTTQKMFDELLGLVNA